MYFRAIAVEGEPIADGHQRVQMRQSVEAADRVAQRRLQADDAVRHREARSQLFGVARFEHEVVGAGR